MTEGATVLVRLQELSRRFGELVAVDRLSLEVHRGEMFGLIGPDGRPIPSAVIRFVLTKPHRIAQLARLARGAKTAANAAAQAASDALAAV